MCRKDLKFNAILNHSDWGTFNEPKSVLSNMFFDTISSFKKVGRLLIICPKHMYRFDLVFQCERRENASISAINGGHDRSRQREWRNSNFLRF